MFFLLLFVLFMCLRELKFSENGLYNDYMSITQTSAINGIFTLLIFMSHSAGYLDVETNGTMFDELYFDVRYYLGQLVVVTFLFYSGYGIMLSIYKKGADYVKKFPKDRFLKVLIMLDISVIIFFIVQTLLGKSFTIGRILESLIAYKDLGNSSWYIFVILILYVLTYVAFMICKDRYWLGTGLVFVLTVGYVYLAVNQFGLESRFYNTAIMYPVGMAFALSKDKIEAWLQKSNILYWSMTALAFIIMQIGYTHRDLLFTDKSVTLNDYALWYAVFSFGFMAFTVLITMKVKIENHLLVWLGKNLFPVYMLQRLPMIIMATLLPDFTRDYSVLFILISFFVTLALAYAFNLLMSKIPLMNKK